MSRVGPGSQRDPAPTLSPEAIIDAGARLRGLVRQTPIVPSSAFGGWLKLETLQLTGAYKVRGALNALMKQAQAGDRRVIVAASAGNHAAGVAWAARAVGLKAVTVVPGGTPHVKIARTEAFGGKVIRHGACFEAAYGEAQRLAQVRGWRFLHAFDDLDVIAGQGTIGEELLWFKPDVVAVPIGGGGLAAGVGTILRDRGISVVGVQVKGVDAMARTLANCRAPFEPAATVADGIRVKHVGVHTAPICARVLDDILLVDEEEVQHAMRQLALTDHVMAEGAGAIAAAALNRLSGRRAVAVISGGNVDPSIFANVLRGPSAQAAVAPATDTNQYI